jgi:hypothetical protein
MLLVRRQLFDLFGSDKIEDLRSAIHSAIAVAGAAQALLEGTSPRLFHED